MNISRFKVFHHNNACLGVAVMREDRVTYKPDHNQYAWFEERPQEWLKDFQKIVRRLCKSVGHNSRFSISTDENSGITVERMGKNEAHY